MEEDVHQEDDAQVQQALQVDVPQPPLFPGQVGLVGLQRAADTRHNQQADHFTSLLKFMKSIKMHLFIWKVTVK